MCGRFTLTVDADELSERFGLPAVVPDYRPRYNVAPSQMVPVILEEQGEKRLVLMKWGLVPRWAKDHAIGSRLINARRETASQKPAFRESWQKRRCIVPADGYYEWMKTGRGKQPVRVVLKSGGLFGLAGLWDSWHDEHGQVLETFTILTTEPAGCVRHIHNRMPFILRPADESVWLQASDESSLKGMEPENNLMAYPVSRLVNSPANDSPHLIAPVPGC